MVLDEQQVIRKILSEYYLDASSKNPRFSLRAFAKKLNISSSALSEILRGKRKVSREKALQFSVAIKQPSSVQKLIEAAFDKTNRIESLQAVNDPPLEEVIISRDHAHIMADWRYLSLGALMRTNDFQSDYDWIGRRLRIAPSEVKNLIDELIQLKIIKRDRAGHLHASPVIFRTSEDFPKHLMTKRRLQGLEAGIEAVIGEAKGEMGYFLTLPVNPERLKASYTIIEDFVRRIAFFLRSGETTEVFELGIQIFPRSIR